MDDKLVERIQDFVVRVVVPLAFIAPYAFIAALICVAWFYGVRPS